MSPRADRLHILGLPVDPVPLEEGAALLLEKLNAGEGGYVVTLNPEMAMAALRRPEVAQTIEESLLSVPDGVGIVWAAKRLGLPPLPRVPGIDLGEALLSRLPPEIPVCFLGGKPGVAEKAAQALKGRFPSLTVAGTHHGYFPWDEVPELAGRIASSGARLLILGMGTPREQAFYRAAKDRLSGLLVMGLGGSLDVWAGRVSRAPRLFRHLGLEWLYRLLRQPSRLRRQTALLHFAWRVFQSSRAR